MPRSQLPGEDNGLICLPFLADRYAEYRRDVNELYAIRERVVEQDLLKTRVVSCKSYKIVQRRAEYANLSLSPGSSRPSFPIQ